jgi:GTP-binding protein
MFCDQTQLEIKAGKGGDGCISLYRAKFLPKGGPDGGDGGKGGSIFFICNENLNSLIELHTKKKFSAQNGECGTGRSMHGKNGEDLFLEVPLGTVIRDMETNNVLYDFSFHEEKFEILKGGRGGYGNEHFKSSIRQTPRFAELGEPGECLNISLELKLVADIGIIGLPSSGKSTLISVISHAKPKIAEYHFTTLIPNLGVVKMSNERSFVACDIPGLIEDASKGKGLGDEFLRHITRSKIILHLVDISEKDPLKNYKLIRKELSNYSEKLSNKKEIIVLSKTDIINHEKDFLNLLKNEFKKLTNKEVLYISSLDKEGINNLLEKIWSEIILEKKKDQEKLNEKNKKIKVFKPHLTNIDPKHFEIKKHIEPGDNYGKRRKEGYRVKGKRFEQIVVMTDFTNRDASMRVRDVIYKMGIQKKLLSLGAITGDTLFVGKKNFMFEPLKMKK